MRDQLPNTAVHVLTNGRAFANDSVATAWAEIRHPDLMAGIPIYAAVDHIHDYVVQAQGAFDETVLGILRLKDKAQRVEVRLVLHAITALRLKQTCEWFARNLPFVDHIGIVLDVLVQSRRDKRAAKRLLRKLLRKQMRPPRVVITDKLGSYGAAKREIMPGIEHRQHKGLNNRAENSHQPTRHESGK
jgi:MoaA/NifB/PqqE/SkfB family radical SAM enzyme